jgi:RNA polymerase sigma-70 factor (ECF subfamily)
MPSSDGAGARPGAGGRFETAQWSLVLLEGVLEALREEYEAGGRKKVFERLAEFLTAGPEAGTHAEAGRELGMSPGAVKVAVHRLRRRYREELRRRVADTLGSEEDVEEEIRTLLGTLGPSREVL